MISVQGSPPPMRGKEIVVWPWSCHRRITPAYAGKRDSCRPLPPWCQDHPRLCGEKKENLNMIDFNTGSPPPMRGKGCEPTKTSFPFGITPAYAGKSQAKKWSIYPRRDHPRLCGEKFASSPFAYRSWGSPPPMRGKATSKYTVFTVIKDHPRLCGEKRCGRRFAGRRLWITPAYAGKRLTTRQLVPAEQDHPRLCGEKWVFQTSHDRAIGSPPPMRGKVLRGSMIRRMSGITPAYAGKSK